MSEIGEQEKIDIIVWSNDPKEFIMNAMSPTKITKVDIMESEKKAVVIVPEDQLSIAIGKSGQNVRLASKLTGYDIDITPDEPKQEAKEAVPVVTEMSQKPRLKRKEQLESSLLDAIEEHGQ
jgi:N utilization substance protein A